MPNKHAILSASSSARWLACPPSAQLCAALPDTVTDYAREGTCAHALAEYKVQKLLGNLTSNPTENLDFYDAEMEDCTDSYAQYIAELLATLQEPRVLVEQRLDFSRYVPDGFGTGDCVIVANSVLTVIDFKYGKGVAVSADHNSQRMLYALGALERFDALYDIAEIRMVIFQPRIQNLSECTLPLPELLHWAETERKPKAALAARGEGEFSAGEHCRFCKGKATCRKRAEYNLQLAKYDFAMPDKLTDTEIETILATADQLTAWVADVKEYALRQALSGKQWHGYKVVAGKANRKYTKPAVVAAAVQAYGKNPYKEPELLGVTAMEQLLGRTQFETLLGSLTEKPQGKTNPRSILGQAFRMEHRTGRFQRVKEFLSWQSISILQK